MKLNGSGYTAKEALAVMIIVCIILVALVPIILSVIDHFSKRVLMNNVISFRNEVDKTLMSYVNSDEEVVDGCYYITTSGNVCLGDYESDNDKCFSESLIIELSGEKPVAGLIYIANNKVVDIRNVRMENYFINVRNDLDYYISEEPQTQTFCRH